MSKGFEARFIRQGRAAVDNRAPPRVSHDVAAVPDEFAHAVPVPNFHCRVVRTV